MDTPFKTPQSRSLKRSNEALYTPRTVSERSDSDESVTSKESKSGSSTDLTVVALFDDLVRLMNYKRDKRTERSYEAFAQESKLLLERYCELFQECQRLQSLVDLKVGECSESERRMNNARLLLDEEKKKTQRVLHQNQCLQDQLDQVRQLLFTDNRLKIGEDAKEKLSFLNTRNGGERNPKNLSCINEVNSTGSMLSDLSFSRSEDGLDTSFNHLRDWKRRVSTADDLDPPIKKRRSSSKVVEIGVTDTVRATTTVTVNKKGPITATSVIESIPQSNGTESEAAPSSDDGIGSTAPSMPPPHMVFESWSKNQSPKPNNTPGTLRAEKRQHSLQQKNIIGRDMCVCCQKKIRFGKSALKCKDCRSLCHHECVDLLPLPCVPLVDTPNNKNIQRVISDYTPTLSPMVPALIVHCTNEIELRGLNELGLYRISASEKEVRSLKEKFLKGRGYPSIVQTDIHVICGCVKDFLRMLTEPLVTYGRWKDFVQAVEAKDNQDVVPALIQCVSELPQPNRDTLAYMMLHLQKVAQSPDCKMPIENLAKVFGPTIVGYSSDNPSTEALLPETMKQISVLNHLIRLPADYWSTFVNVLIEQPNSGLQQTPSTDSLFRPNVRYFTPNSARLATKKRRFFFTPPAYKI